MPKAIELWKIYLKEFKPRSIKRLALRYINVIEISASKFELDDYFTQPIKPATGLPEELESFLSRLVIRLEDDKRAIVTITPLSSNKPGTASIVFDIEVFSAGLFSDVPEKLEEEFLKLHKSVFDIIEKSLTPKAKELFK